MVFWWGMKEVSSVGNHGGGNPQDSWRTNTLPMPTGLAPPKHHGVFLFGSDRQGALANGLHGLNPRNTDNRTHPLICRPALIERLVKDWVQRWNKAQSISESIRQAHLVLRLFINLTWSINEAVKRWSGVESIHPWRTYA